MEYPTGETVPPSLIDHDVALGRAALLETTLANSLEEEARRTDIVNANITMLKKRFGETFVKGERLETGGYTGGGARELLASFMEIPGFAGVLKQLIPNKHQALTTLQDNHDYITHYLKVGYEKIEQYEPELPGNPYELAAAAGYELTGPFDSVADFITLKDDFRDGERICTFNNPEARLKTYHIMWLRHAEADSIVPADQLTQENLTEPWKEYLRTTGRYDPETDTYDLADLKPQRQDPYGTSSMSVQVSRRGNHVSIKNRYNHAVANPDNTHGNNLDDITDGLGLAVYSMIGRAELNDVHGQTLHDEYTLDNKGGIHHYYREDNNVYLGYYEQIENGVVTTVDRGAYDMISSELYVSKKKDGTVINVVRRAAKTSHEVQLDGTHHLHIHSANDSIQCTYMYRYDEHGAVPTVNMYVPENVQAGHICSNPVLTELVIGENATVLYIANNPVLVKVTIAKGARTATIGNNLNLTELKLGEYVYLESIQRNPALAELSIPSHTKINFAIIYNISLTKLTIGSNSEIKTIGYNPSLVECTFAPNVRIDEISHNTALSELTITEGSYVGTIYNEHSLTKLTIGKGSSTDNIAHNSSLAELVFAEGARSKRIYNNISLYALTITKGSSVGSIFYNPELTQLTIAEGASTGEVYKNPKLTDITRATGSSVESVYDNNSDLVIHQ